MSVETLTPHMRFWLGKRLSNLPPQAFAQALMEGFIPGTPALLFPLGLRWYAPVILPFEKPLGMADELAWLIYETKEAYEEAQKTWTGKIYGAAHSGLFEFSNKASTSMSHEGWHLSLAQDKLAVLGAGEWPADWPLSHMGPEHMAMAALQFAPVQDLATLQATVEKRLNAGLHAASLINAPVPIHCDSVPTRLHLVWQPNPIDHPQAGPNLYIWLMSAMGNHWARDALNQVLRQALPAAFSPDPLNTSIWLWQAPCFELSEVTNPNSTTTKESGASFSAWGKGWVYVNTPAPHK